MSGAPDALVDFHTGEKSARLDAAQKEILAIGKERWVEKVEETRMIRKMAGLVALGMSLLTVFYAREIHWLVRGRQVKWLAAAGLAWGGGGWWGRGPPQDVDFVRQYWNDVFEEFLEGLILIQKTMNM